jgi:APA family basic amino acid/polyamine antiporter
VSATTYARRLGLFSGTMAVVGGIIGSGIFLNPSIVARRVPMSLVVPVWTLGGAIALVGAFCFAELGHRRPRAGGGYVYLRESFGALPAFLYGWALLLVISTGAAAAVAVTFARYTAALLGLDEGTVVPMAVLAIALLSAISYLGVGPSAVTQNVFTVLKLGAVAALIVCGLFLPHGDAIAAAATPVVLAPWRLPLAVGTALVPILFAYGGWQQTNFIAEEIVDAERTLPRALVIGTALVVLVYVSANLAYLRVLGPGLAVSAAPAADVMGVTLGPWGRRLISLGIACSSFGFLNLVILVTPRVYQAMAADGVFFPALARLHPRFRTPGTAIIVQGAWAILLTLSGTYEKLLDYVVFGDWIFFGLTAATLFVYRRRFGAPGSHGVPFYPLAPALFVAVAAYVVASSVASNPHNALLGAALMLAGVPVYLFWSRRGVRA